MTKKISSYKTGKVILIIIYSILYAIGLQLFMQPANLLTTGMAGVAQILSNVSDWPYGYIFMLINIPGIIIGFKYIGKKFTLYSMLNIFTVSIVTIYLPVIKITDDIIVNAVFGGILIGYSLGRILKVGGSSGGTDFFVMYLLRYKNMDFQKVNLTINVFIIILGILYYSLYFPSQKVIELGLYTIISLYVRNTVLDQTFTNTHILTLFIVGDHLENVSKYINQTLRRGTTIIKEVEGGYTHEKKTMLMATLNQYEYSLFIEEVHNINPGVFINIVDTKKVEGNYKKSKK